ncbi:NACHT domain-containing protein [Pseudomonas sp. Gutcm_11s]|uniref:NACHT domain-containing protein n=1 Tax=Pseudomonas sp. Gutcm_11s TaxID=3026088 RepID=UPI00235DEEA0|nr:NACHT domain-containing protein [Pseudomonas sp. Gutcm_11s]MDD0844616.1 NACHT domain-containing protein [Pseudomonas sp. Gutcm_11s]
MNSHLSSNHKFLIICLVLGVLAIAMASLLSGYLAILAAVVFCLTLFILRHLVMPPGYGANRIRALSLIGAFGIVASWGAWANIVNSAIKSVLSQPEIAEKFPWASSIKIDGEPPFIVLLFVLACIWIVNHYMQDRSIASGHPNPLDEDFPEERFQSKLASFCSALNNHLVQVDLESNWSPDYYTELEVEVEILSSHRSIYRKKIMNLQSAIRADRASQAFLILGTPGAGKSVALRKLARDMLKEVGSTGRIPIYINLREWAPSSTALSPSVSELERFVIESVKARGDLFTEDFVDSYFKKLWSSGRLFFIFDSFDEMPLLLDTDESSEIINSLSEMLFRFISSQNNSRGVLASRVFRRPTQSYLAQKVLEIRPLSETSIHEALDRFPAFTSELKNSLFRDRLDLVPIARNPFLMALLGEWVNEQHTLPANQAQIYESYLLARLAKCTSKISSRGLTVEEIMEATKEIAWFVFNSHSYGLEAPVRVISSSIGHSNIESVIEILSYARIARVTKGESSSFAFVHRRFLEYFVTMRLLETPSDAPIEHIPTDSRGRDALVLYAQLCSDEEAQRLGLICWKEIQDNFRSDINRLRAIHCLRFLVDAFFSRRSAISSFQTPLGKLIRQHVENGDNIIHAKICLEATGLLPESESVPILNLAIEGEDSWLQETSFRACRNLPRLEKNLESGMISYLERMPIIQFWRTRRILKLGLSLSDSLQGVKKIADIRSFNIQLSILATIAAAIISPETSYLSMGVTLFIFFLAALSNLVSASSVTIIKKQASYGFFPFFAPTLADALISIFRFAAPGLFMWNAAIRLLAPAEYKSAPYYGESFFDGIGWGLPELDALPLILISIAILDWLLIARAFRGILRAVSSIKIALEICAYIAVGITGLLLVASFVEYIKGGIIYKVIGGFFVVALILLIIGYVFLIIGLARDYTKDFLLVRSIHFSSSTTRAEIAKKMAALRTTHGKSLYVSKLEKMRVIAVGDWPSDFKLTVGGGAALSALARLEEKWLRLDR